MPGNLKPPLVIIGAGGHSRVVIDCVEVENKYQIIGLISDKAAKANSFRNYRILGSIEILEKISKEYGEAWFLVAIGDNFTRKTVTESILFQIPKFKLGTTIHPTAYVSKDSRIGEGSVLLAQSVVSTKATIGLSCIVNHGATLDHDSTMEGYSSLAPGVHTGGNVSIGCCSSLGVGASVIHGITIGAHSVIGAGSCVVRNISDGVVAYGNPARVIRNRAHNDRYL